MKEKKWKEYIKSRLLVKKIKDIDIKKNNISDLVKMNTKRLLLLNRFKIKTISIKNKCLVDYIFTCNNILFNSM